MNMIPLLPAKGHGSQKYTSGLLERDPQQSRLCRNFHSHHADTESVETSGHWDHYKENMYTTQIDETDFAVKPMNCPGGILVYQSEPRSYRDLPLRMGELGLVHRHENPVSSTA